jgi:hypothetical protein
MFKSLAQSVKRHEIGQSGPAHISRKFYCKTNAVWRKTTRLTLKLIVCLPRDASIPSATNLGYLKNKEFHSPVRGNVPNGLSLRGAAANLIFSDGGI